MTICTIVLTLLVAIEHLYILWLETIATHSKTTSKVFGISVEDLASKPVSTLLKNQGVYNGLLALLLIVAVCLQDILWIRLLLGFVFSVAIYGSITSKPSILLKQGLPAAIALISSFF